jgi:DNA-binding XRE family transcriptional regulator
MSRLATIVRNARCQERRMTQEQFVTAVGIRRATVCMLEAGGRPSGETVAKLATFLKCPVEEVDPDCVARSRRSAPSERLSLQFGRTTSNVRTKRSSRQGSVGSLAAGVYTQRSARAIAQWQQRHPGAGPSRPQQAVQLRIAATVGLTTFLRLDHQP